MHIYFFDKNTKVLDNGGHVYGGNSVVFDPVKAVVSISADVLNFILPSGVPVVFEREGGLSIVSNPVKIEGFSVADSTDGSVGVNVLGGRLGHTDYEFFMHIARGYFRNLSILTNDLYKSLSLDSYSSYSEARLVVVKVSSWVSNQLIPG